MSIEWRGKTFPLNIVMLGPMMWKAGKDAWTIKGEPENYSCSHVLSSVSCSLVGYPYIHEEVMSALVLRHSDLEIAGSAPVRMLHAWLDGYPLGHELIVSADEDINLAVDRLRLNLAIRGYQWDSEH